MLTIILFLWLWLIEGQISLIANFVEHLWLQSSTNSSAAVFKWCHCGQDTEHGISQMWTSNSMKQGDGTHQSQILFTIPCSFTNRATVTVCMASSKQGLKETSLMSPQLEDRGSTYEGFEVRKDRWWAFPLQLSHLFSLQHWALYLPVGDSLSLCFYIILPSLYL